MKLCMRLLSSGLVALLYLSAGFGEAAMNQTQAKTPLAANELQEFRLNKESTGLMAINKLEESLNLPSRLKAVPARIDVDEFGNTHTRIQIEYHGIPVIGASAILHTDPNGVESQSGTLPTIPDLETTPTINIKNVEQIVASEIGITELTANRIESELQIILKKEKTLKEGYVLSDAPTATDFKDKVIGARLVYRAQTIAVGSHGSEGYLFEIDAHTGKVLAKLETLRGGRLGNNSPALPIPKPPLGGDSESQSEIGISQYSGTVLVPTRKFDDLFPVLGKSKRTFGSNGTEQVPTIEIRSSEGNDPWLYDSFDDVPPLPATGKSGDGNNYTVDDLATSDPVFSAHAKTAAIDVLYGATVTWDLWHKVFDHTGMDGAGQIPFWLVVHSAQSIDTDSSPYYNYAGFAKGVAVFPDPSVGEKQETTPEFVAHELAHGFFTEATGWWPAAGSVRTQTDGISEANSDILGTVTEFYESTYPSPVGTTVPLGGGNWTFGERATPDGAPIRYLYKPSEDGSSFDAWRPDIDSCCDDEYQIAGPMNRMFYFLSKGVHVIWGDPYRNSVYLPTGMTGIGIDKAARIWFKAVKFYLPNDADFEQMRYACEQAAGDLYGKYSVEHRGVQDAFAAVNVGRPADRNPPMIEIEAPNDASNFRIDVSLDDFAPGGGEIKL